VGTGLAEKLKKTSRDKMKNIEFVVGKTNTGFDAYREEEGRIVAVTTGTGLAGLKSNILESYNLY
jgi:hypothetical protein